MVRIVLVGLLGLLLAVTGLLALMGPEAIKKAPYDPVVVAGEVSAQTLAFLLVVAFMYYLVVHRYRTPFWEGVKWKWPPGRSALACLGGGVVLALGAQVAQRFLPTPESAPIEEALKQPDNAWLIAAFGILVAPFVEEMFFRGFLFPVLARFLGRFFSAAARGRAAGAAVFLTALVFTAIHGPQLANHWASLSLLFAVSLAFTAARALTGSVAVPFLMHVSYNTTLFAVLFYATDGFQNMEKALH